MAEIFTGSERSGLSIWRFLKSFAKVVIGGALILQAILFILVLSVILSILAAVSDQMEPSDRRAEYDDDMDGVTALYFNPAGLLSETAPLVDPFQEALEEVFGGAPGQVSVHHLVKTLEEAQDDENITTLILNLEELIIPDIYLSKANLLADAVEAFRESGKRVIAVGDYYGQNQYLVASEADTVLMHHQGFFFMPGYGRFRTYYASMLDKLDVTKNIFRVGTYKSALEPMLRDDMSPEAREANEQFLSVIWDRFTQRVDDNRDMDDGATKRFTNAFGEALASSGGDIAQAALDSGYVDQLVSRDEQRDLLVDVVGEDDEGELNTIEYIRYADHLEEPEDREDVGNIAIVTVEGPIIDGPQDVGVASGEYVSNKLREAREDEAVKAVVLRVDSPGGSVFASELIRNEVEAIKAAGKPVVVSMSSLAASGGYWISSPADAIWARETTLTGSIGIFAYVPTFEKLAERFGVFTDGVGTTPYAGIAATGIGPLPEPAKDMFQQSIEHGYEQFLELVAEGRDMSVDEVAAIAEGRVWIGQDAATLKLVDAFGGLDDAIADAAERAGLEDWDIAGSMGEKTIFERLLENFGVEEGQAAGRGDVKVSPLGMDPQRIAKTPLGQAVKLLDAETRFQASFDDPRGLYVRCLECGAF